MSPVEPIRVPSIHIPSPLGTPVTIQPGVFPAHADIWMSLPTPVEGVPPGLEYLTMVDEIMIHRISGVLDLFTGFQTKNKYAVSNANGVQMYYVFEESKNWQRLVCGPYRSFTMHFVDGFGALNILFFKEVLRIRRPFACCACFGLCACLPGCGPLCTIECPPGHTIGTVEQRMALCSSSFIVRDHEDDVILRIDGQLCCLNCGCQEKEFPIETLEGERIGCIKRKSGKVGEDAKPMETFRLTFPINFDARLKAILIGAAFLIGLLELEATCTKRN
ncbi:unnamed protein product [Cylicocyclus nassatus]|uniref:Phospholipid scramblase n=1 Tax=Cylicocyclus nassatus TaxID=53992 RepID=A0AA36M2Y2_CYLNA|nr:unnamed protein product [Cylicocyclus nassatus]